MFFLQRGLDPVHACFLKPKSACVCVSESLFGAKICTVQLGLSAANPTEYRLIRLRLLRLSKQRVCVRVCVRASFVVCL